MDAKDLLPGEEQWIQKYRAALDLPSAERKTLSIRAIANQAFRIVKSRLGWLLVRRMRAQSQSTAPAPVIAPRPALVISKRDPNGSTRKPSIKKTAAGTVAIGTASSKRKKSAN
jgi:hypothetical protein